MLSNRSLILILLPAMISGGIALFINWRIHREMKGVGLWPLGTAISILGGALRGLEGELPDVASILVGTFLLVGGQFVVLFGISRFANQPIHARTALVMMIGLVFGMVYFTWIYPFAVARTAVFSIALASTLVLQIPALISLGRQEGLAGVAVLAFVYVSVVVLLATRLFFMHVDGGLPTFDFNTQTLSSPQNLNQILGHVCATALVILRAYGYILLSTSRVHGRLRQTATVDALTGLPNRRALDDEIRRVTPRVRRDRIRCGVAIFDIDFFKRVNDTHGHAAGDAMLIHFADVVRSVLRDSDFFARAGGEEFILVIADTNASAFRQAAERIRVAFEQTPLVRAAGDLRATVSAGLAVSPPGEMDYGALNAQADAALYRAKGNGRNRVEVVELEKPSAVTERTEPAAVLENLAQPAAPA